MGLIEEASAGNRTDSGKDGRDHLGRFAAGNPGKQAGSARNKLRDDLKKFVSDNLGNLEVWMLDLKPREKIEVIISLMPYLVPRLKQVDMNAVVEDNSIKKTFPFGGFVDGTGKWIPVGRDAYYLDSKVTNARDEVASLFPTEDELNDTEKSKPQE